MGRPQARRVTSTPGGFWRVTAHPTGGAPIDVTKFRDAPTKVSGLVDSDPFGPAAVQLAFPAMTSLERLGTGDTWWARPFTDVDVEWVSDGVVLARYPFFLVSPDYSGIGVTWSCKGALHALDFTKAKPEYLYQPLPYEVAIRRQFLNRPDLHLLTPDEYTFPSWWTKTFRTADYPRTRPYLLPSNVRDGQKWSGMVTRETGSWDNALTGYIQSLLANMHTERGQFTLLVNRDRKPYLTHRDHLATPTDDTLVVDLLWPGVDVSGSEDWSQTVDVIYAQGKAMNGDTYTGMEVTADGSSTWYQPAAARRQAWPAGDRNPWFSKDAPRRELVMEFPDGLTAAEAKTVAKAHLARFAEPGFVGSLRLSTDPQDRNGNPVPRQTLRAGTPLLVKGLLGTDTLVHAAEVTHEDLETTITIDSKFRDFLTIDQVRKRGRDALVPYRLLTPGGFDPRIPDLLYPWSYSSGAGVVPYAGSPLFTRYGPAAADSRADVADPFAVPFPWTEYTTAFPPRTHPQFYMRVPPADRANANLNWANKAWKASQSGAKNLLAFKPWAVRLAAAGEIKLFQMAAYDRDGNVKRVPFHVSVYYESGVSYTSMPMLPAAADRKVTSAATVSTVAGDATVTIRNLPRNHGIIVGEMITVASTAVSEAAGYWQVATVSGRTITFERGTNATATKSGKATIFDPYLKNPIYAYEPGQHYPFFPNAWEQYLPDGRTPRSSEQMVAKATMIAGWGTGYEKAGYWPGASSDSDDLATGLLVDESGFSFDFTKLASGVSVMDTAAENQKTPLRVTAYVMVYCDADVAASTYFLGRMFRKEYGAS